MSTKTQVHVKPVITHYRISDQSVVSVDQILGPGGTALLRETLAALVAGSESLSQGMNMMFDWELVDEDCYRTQVEGVAIDLQLSGSLAEVCYAYDRHIQGTARPIREPAIQKRVNQKVNQVLGLAAGRKIAQGLEQQIKLSNRQQQRIRQPIQKRVLSKDTIQVNASLRR